MPAEAGAQEIVTLVRAARAADLWPAIEAAQYGRIVQCQLDEAAPARAPADAFLAALEEVIEGWEAGPDVQAVLIQRLEALLSALEENGGRLDWGLVHRIVRPAGAAPVSIPIGVVHIGPPGNAVVEIAVPRQLDAGENEPPA